MDKMSYMESENFKEWRENHMWNQDYIPIGGTKANGDPVIVFYCKNKKTPFSVQYRGNGHYFETLEQAQEYVRKRFNKLASISADDLMKI